MQIIIELLKSFKQAKKGVSNVIVVMLSLILIVIIVSNVILWSYQMNQLDWEKRQEDITITDVVSIRDTWSYNPSGYALGGSTIHLSGDVSDLTSDDGVYMSFGSYYSGTDVSDFVDATCDLHPPPTIGSHSLFSAQKNGPDSICDTLTEENTGEVFSLEDAVDNDASNVDGSADVGTLSNFDNMKTKDGMAILTEASGTVWFWQEDTGGYVPTSSYETFQFWSSWTTNSTTSGTVTKIGIYVFADPGNSPQVKLGIYDDIFGSPNNLLGETNAATITGAGWLDLDIVGGGVSISASTTYHVAHITDIAPITQWRYFKITTPVSDYRNGRFWPNLFDPAGATTKSFSYRYGAYRVGYDEYRLDQEVQWTDIPYLDQPNEELCIYGGTMGSEDIKVDAWNGTGWENVFNDLSIGWNNQSITDWLADPIFTIRFKGGSESGDTTQDQWEIDIALIHVWSEQVNYELDLEVQWTSADHDETNEWLCIYGGTMSASEDILVDVWNGSAWENLFTDLSSGWNNVSVSSYLESSTFTIRFKGSMETGDTNQDSWEIDVTLLHVWSDEYAAEVEFTGSSNMEDWSQLTWTVNSAWTAGSVGVTLQLYNYILDDYPTSGNGYMFYISVDTPNTDENKSQTINVNPTHYRNATGHWKMKIKGAKAVDTPFDFKADWIEFEVAKDTGTLFTVKNKGSLTSHLVSLWIVNSTLHQRYNLNVFVNSGETLSYPCVDIYLPSGQYVVKVVTERGNIAVYSST